MSTSPATPTSSDHQPVDPARFRRGLVATIVVLVIACAGLGAASVLQGPRIQGAQLDVAAAVVAPASLRIVLNEAVAPIDEGSVTVTPEVPLTVQNDGDIVLVHFDRALEYDTAYTVTLAGMSAAGGGVTVDLTHELRTPSFQVTWLQRTGEDDSVVTASPGGDVTTLFTGPQIQDFLPLDGAALLIATLDDADASHASIVATDGSGNVEELTLPGAGPGRIGVLEQTGTNVLYTYTTQAPAAGAATSPAFDQTLFLLDLGGTHISEPVTGIDGEPISVDRVIPVPGTTEAFLHTRAGQVLRYDPAGDEPPALVAEYAEMVALAGDRQRLSVKDAFGPLLLDLDTGSETRIEPSPIVGTEAVPFIADVIPVRDGRWIERAVLPNADFTAFDSFVAIDDGEESSLLFRTIDPAGSVVGYRMTSNDRYLVAEVSPGGDSFQASDGYAEQARPRDVTTVVIDIWEGSVVAEWPGSHARW